MTKQKINTKKVTMTPHSRQFFTIKRILNIILHFMVCYLLFFFTRLLFKSIYKDDGSVHYYIAKLISPVQLSLVIIVNVFYIILYYNEFPYFEKLKSNSLEWPWKENPKFFKNVLTNLIQTYALNFFLIFPAVTFVVLNLFPCRMDLQLPSFFEHWVVMMITFVFEDFMFYWVHRIIHHPKLYWIHKKHHQFYNTIHLACTYTHWIEFIMGNVLTIFLAEMIFQKHFHIISVFGAMQIRFIETHESHGGYNFEFSVFQIFPGMTDSSYHNYHHLKNLGNYGTYFTFWDNLFGTNDSYFKTPEITFQ